MVIKLDMANAFDRVNHKFLVVVLQKFGISSKFLDIVMACTTTPWIAPLINGRPSSFFRSTRGLRQGCPLSPFLYIIMVELLSIQLENQREKRKIIGIRITRGVKEINHYVFADDTLLIGGASNIIARWFKKVLDDFLYALGGLLNNKKCVIYNWNTPINIIHRNSQIMEILVQLKWSHFINHGLPLAKEVVKEKVWNKQVEKMRGKIQSWGMAWLNLAGRSILIKALLSALLIYQYVIIMASANAHKQMELITRSFLWQGRKQETKIFSLVRWGQVTLPYEKGGISIRIPGLMNNALGIKFVWRMINGKEQWWGEALQGNF